MAQPLNELFFSFLAINKFLVFSDYCESLIELSVTVLFDHMSCKACEVTGKQINHVILLLLLLRVLSILLLAGHTLFVISVLVGRRLRSVVLVEVKRIWL